MIYTKDNPCLCKCHNINEKSTCSRIDKKCCCRLYGQKYINNGTVNTKLWDNINEEWCKLTLEDQYMDESTIQTRRNEVLKDFNFNQLLDKYGPEGLFILAEKLTSVAQNDIDGSMNETDI